MADTQNLPEQNTTLRVVAERAGVSPSSVSRALGGHPDVSEATKRRVLEAASDLGYRPDWAARSLRTGKTRSFGFLVRDLSSPLFSRIVKGAERRARETGHALLLIDSDGDEGQEIDHIDLLRRRGIDGLILSVQSESTEGLGETLRSATIPVVLVDRQIEDVDAHAVLLDHFTGGVQAMDDLLGLGHIRIAFIAAPKDLLPSRERLRAYRTALEVHGVRFDDALVRVGPDSVAFGKSVIETLLDQADPPTAVVVSSTQLFVGVLGCLRERGITVGGELSVVVCEDTLLFEYMTPSISAVSFDAAAIGQAATDLLLEAAGGGENGSVTRHIPTSYTKRESTQPPKRTSGPASKS